MRTHYALRLVRSVRHFGETIWQPFCGKTDLSEITMTTELGNVTCLDCRNRLIKERHKLGIGKKINHLLRRGKWRVN